MTQRRAWNDRLDALAHEKRNTRLWLRIARTGAVLLLLLLAARMIGWTERLAYVPTRGNVPEPPPGAEELYFPSTDEKTLHGWFIPARVTSSDEKHGSVLYIHGNAGNVGDHVGFAAFLPQAGFDVLVFDYRGYGNSDAGRIRRAALLKDSHAALDALLARPEVDPAHVFVYAQSLGGAFAFPLMEQRPEVRAAVVMSTFSSWRGVAASVLSRGEPGPIARGFAWLAMPAGLDPLEHLPRIVDRPVLLMHGTDDDIVHFHHARALSDRGANNVTLRAVAGGGHNDLLDVEPGIAQEIARFFESAPNR